MHPIADAILVLGLTMMAAGIGMFLFSAVRKLWLEPQPYDERFTYD